MSNNVQTQAELLAQVRRLAIGTLDDRDALRSIRDLFRDYDEGCVSGTEHREEQLLIQLQPPSHETDPWVGSGGSLSVC